MRIFVPFLTLLLFSCGGPASLIVPAQTALPTKAQSIETSAATRGVTPAEFSAIDEGFGKATPPEELWNSPELREKAAIQWASLCASCHGVEGKLKNVPAFDPSPRAFGGMGMSMGFLMGGNKMRAKVFQVIQEGRNEMPRFGERLTNQEIWGIVYFLEHL